MASRNVPEAEFIAIMERAKVNGVVKHCTFLHNTASLTYHFRGASTIAAFDRDHRARGYTRGLACHGYAAPDGTVWTARTFHDHNCACQNPPQSHPWRKVYAPLQALIERTRSGLPWRSWPNRYGIGIETVGNYSIEDPTRSSAMQTSLNIIAAAHRIWKIPVEHCFFHRDVAPTACPGNNTKREWVHAELRKRLEGEPMPEVDVDEWAAPSVERVKAAGIMHGKSEDYFGGREPITRQEVAVVADRLLAYIEEATP